MPEMKSAGRSESSSADATSRVSPPPPATIAKTPRDGFTFLAEYWLDDPSAPVRLDDWTQSTTSALMFVIDGPGVEIRDVVLTLYDGDHTMEWRPPAPFSLGATSPSHVIELPVSRRISQLRFRFGGANKTTRLLLWVR
jgi:hypothetical protein